MKRIVVILMVLSMVEVADSKLWLCMNDMVDPPPITLIQNQTAKISIWGDGTEWGHPDSEAALFLTISGPGSLNILGATNAINTPGYDSSIFIWLGDPADGAVFIDIVIPIEPFSYYGTVADNIFLNCDGVGDVTLSLYHDEVPVGGQFLLVDTQVIHQIPEPITIALLGLGGLFLRRRK